MLGGKNKQQHRPLGYTIVEVMIVLAVSGMMFVIAANFINGKQERAAFTQGSTDTGSILQNVVEDITDGHYSDVPLQCHVNGSGTSITANTGTGVNQGQNQDCVFLGKIVRFYAPGGVGDRTNYGVYSIAAARSVTDFPDNLVGAIGGLTTNTIIPQSLYVNDMQVAISGGPPNTTAFNIGFVQGVGSADGVGVYLSGAQQPVQLVYADVPGGDVAAIGAGTDIKPAKSATICLSDGTRYARILIGNAVANLASNSNNNNQLGISVEQLGTAPC